MRCWTPSSQDSSSLVCWTSLDLRSLMWVNVYSWWYNYISFIHIRLLLSLSVFLPILTPVQQLGAAVHQLHQWETATVLQSPHVCAGARGIQKRRNWLGVHWLWHGLGCLHWAYWEGNVARHLVRKKSVHNIFLVDQHTVWKYEWKLRHKAETQKLRKLSYSTSLVTGPWTVPDKCTVKL